jgi:hypothetical protein
VFRFGEKTGGNRMFSAKAVEDCEVVILNERVDIFFNVLYCRIFCKPSSNLRML